MTHFFTLTKEKVYITVGFVVARWLLGLLNRINIAAKLPFFVNMMLAALDLVVSLPMKIIFATPALKKSVPAQILIVILFVAMFAYWYVFACVVWRAYENLNRQDAEARTPQPKEEEQAKT